MRIKALELTGRIRGRASLSSRSAARVGATSPGGRRSVPGTLAGGRQLNAWPLGGAFVLRDVASQAWTGTP